MSLFLNAMQKVAAEDRSAMCLVLGKTGTGKTALLTEKARILHEEGGIPYTDMAVIFQSERDAAIARNALISDSVKPQELRFFGTSMSVSYELLRMNLNLDCLDWFHNGFSVMDAEQEYDIAVRLMAQKDYGIFKNNLRLKIGKALRGNFVGSEEENTGLENLYEDLRSYLRNNRIIIRDKLPEWAMFLAGKPEAALPSVVLADNIHRASETEWNALLALARRAKEATFTIDPVYSALHQVNGENEASSCQDLLAAEFAVNQVTLEYNYRATQLPLVCASVLALDEVDKKEGMPLPGGNISITSFTDSREAALKITTQIEELRIRGAQYSEIAILYADGFMQKTLASILREHGIPFENGLGDYLGASTAAAWLVRVLRYALNPVNTASGAEAIYDRHFGDTGLRRIDGRGERGGAERLPSRSALYQKMRWFVSSADGAPSADAAWLYSYFEVEGRLRRNQQAYDTSLRGIKSVLDTIEELRVGGRRTLLQAVAQFLCNYNVRGRYALIRPFFPNCVHVAHYKVDSPYNFPFLFITDCNDGKVSFIDGDEETKAADRKAFYTAVRRCSFELMLSFMRTRTAKNGLVHKVYPSPLLAEIPTEYLSCDKVTLESLKAGRGSHFPEESLLSYEEFMAGFDEEQKAIIRSSDAITLLRAPVGTGKTRMIVGRILYLNQEQGVPFHKMFVSCFSKRAVSEILDAILHIRGLSNLSTVLDFPLFGTFESLCVKLLNKRLRISDFGYGRGFRIQKEDLELYNALQIAAQLKSWDSPEEERATVSLWLEVVYRELYSGVCDDIAKLCGTELQFGYSGELDMEVITADPVYREFANRLSRWKKDNNLMSMKDARCLATSLVGEMKDKISDIIVDEFQDFDALQLGFVNALIGDGARLFAAGDPEQVIYEWRCNGNRSFECFKEHYNAKECTLSHNYRSQEIAQCAQTILHGADDSIPCNENVILCRFNDVDQEASYVADRILKLKEQGVSLNDIAIFFRIPNGAQRLLTTLLQNNDIPVNVWASHTPYGACQDGNQEVAEVQEGVSLLSLHRSKGVEYKHVIILDCALSDLSSDRFRSEDNERHLYYVGMTRASKGLDLLWVADPEEAQSEEPFAQIPGVKLELSEQETQNFANESLDSDAAAEVADASLDELN